MAALCLIALTAADSTGAADSVLRDKAFLTCSEVNVMPAEQRKTLTLDIADMANDYYQSKIADSAEVGEKIGWLIRSACTIAPQAYYSTIVARAVRVAGGGSEPPLQQPLNMSQAVFLTCAGTRSLPQEQLKQLGSFIGNEAAAHYDLTPGPAWTPDYIAALVYNGCQMFPDAYYLGMIGRAIRAVSGTTSSSPPPG